MAKSSKAGSITWTGENLADVKKFHSKVEHYPEKTNQLPHYRDWSQHPDNLHVEDDEGTTHVVEVGDTLHRLFDGTIRVEKGDVAPRALRRVAPSKGQVHHVTAGPDKRSNGK